ncbi:hypothetical protein ACFQY0_10405 [Haloferula chungangensis]|uniref:Uncharacterized protein n=1 Tax=Haloferula chungangensis TaxID=1048331 RepID=A0ABW2L5E0_9BACT
MTNAEPPIHETCMGFCRTCGVVHSLPEGRAADHGREMMDLFSRIRRLDYLASDEEADPQLSFDYLFQEGRGHMFGVLDCLDPEGNQVVLRAFSSLRDGVRHIAGWVPPIHSDELWDEVVLPAQAEIKALTRKIHANAHDPATAVGIREERKRISRGLVATVQDQLLFTNFRGEQRFLRDVFSNSGDIPGGVGDCCGPKLLNHAALMRLKPMGLAEFYWGASTPSGSRVQGRFYPCCQEKCQPILGFMLCGIDELS